MTTRRAFLVTLTSAAIPYASLTRAEEKIWRVGYLGSRARPTASKPDAYYATFVEAMRDLGYVEGKNLAIEWRFAEDKYERLPALAAELVRTKPDVLVTHVNQAARALFRQTGTIPIVCSSLADPVRDGMAVSLSQPGRNITGLTTFALDAGAKRLELLSAMVPRLARIGLLVNPNSATREVYSKSIEDAARQRGLAVLQAEARSREEIALAFGRLAAQRVDGVVAVNDGMFFGHPVDLAESSVKYRLPSVFPYRDVVAAGGLMSYGPSLAYGYHEAARYVDRIFKGAKAGELPIEQPTRLELFINQRTARLLGLAIPPKLQLLADKVME